VEGLAKAQGRYKAEESKASLGSGEAGEIHTNVHLGTP
jgi:hypothetical protein